MSLWKRQLHLGSMFQGHSVFNVLCVPRLFFKILNWCNNNEHEIYPLNTILGELTHLT